MIQVDITGLPGVSGLLRRIEKKSRPTLAKALDRIRFVVERRVKMEAYSHKVTGGYVRSIKSRRLTSLSAVVFSSLSTATILERGSKPRTITAKKGRVLRFVIRGVTLYRRSVHHPGTKAYKIFERGLAASEREVDAILWKALRGIE